MKITVFWDHSSTLQLKAAGYSETTVNIYQTTWHHIPEDGNLQTEDKTSCMHVCTTDIATQWELWKCQPVSGHIFTQN
jgi:hypothetical protein